MGTRSRMTLLVRLLLCSALVAWPAGVRSQQVSSAALQKRLKRQRKALADVKEELRRRAALIASKRAEERSLLLELEAADRQLAVIRTEAALATREVDTHQERAATLEAEAADLEARLARQRRTLAKHLRRLEQQRTLTTAQVLLTAPTLTAAAEQAKYTRRLARLDRERIARYRATLQALRARRSQIDTTAPKLTRARSAVARQAKKLRLQVKSKRGLLASIQRERRLHEQVLEEMDAATRDLESFVAALEEKRVAGPSPPVETELASLPQPASFVLLKGRLPWPVPGNLVAASGRVARLHRGLTIMAPEGDPIRAVAAGTVVFADTFRGYGNICIIDHGSGYHTLYAHAQEITVRVGERVEAGQVIGRVGSSGAASTPRLYFELRHRGRSIDPRRWMVARAQ